MELCYLFPPNSSSQFQLVLGTVLVLFRYWTLRKPPQVRPDPPVGEGQVKALVTPILFAFALHTPLPTTSLQIPLIA